MRRIMIALGMVAIGALTPLASQAQVQIGPTLAFHDDFDLGLGGTLTVQMPAIGEGIGFMADFLMFFPSEDNVDYLEINGNVTYDFRLEGSAVQPFALLGLNVARASVDAGSLGDESNTEIGLNVGGGIAFNVGSLRPSLGGRFEISGGEGFVVFFTLPFEVSGN